MAYIALQDKLLSLKIIPRNAGIRGLEKIDTAVRQQAISNFLCNYSLYIILLLWCSKNCKHSVIIRKTSSLFGDNNLIALLPYRKNAKILLHPENPDWSSWHILPAGNRECGIYNTAKMCQKDRKYTIRTALFLVGNL